MINRDSMVERLRHAGLRPTEQRIALGTILFANHHRHVTAEELHAEAAELGVQVSLATVYNALNDFNQAGLVRTLAMEGAKTWFDTNTADHHHFFVEGKGAVYDVEGAEIRFSNLPEPPAGFKISNVDVVIRLRQKADP